MVHHSAGLHHLHKRKRIHQNHEKYPHPDKLKRILDKIIYVMAAVGPVMALPQVYKIWIDKNATGVSVLSWITFLITAIFWVFYGIIHKEKPLILMYSGWIVIDLIIVIGIFIYG